MDARLIAECSNCDYWEKLPNSHFGRCRHFSELRLKRGFKKPLLLLGSDGCTEFKPREPGK